MLLTTFITFSALGFGIWLLGHLLYQTERSGVFIAIASIGAIIVMVTGGAVALDDVHQRTGQVIEKDYQEAANVTNLSDSVSEIEVVNNETRVRYETRRISLTDNFGSAFGQLGLGGLEMIVGALLMIRDLEEVSF